MKKVDSLLRYFVEEAVSKGFELFLSPETEALKVLSEINNGVVFFQARDGQLYKLRSDYTTSVIDYFNKCDLSFLKVWYSGFMYRYDPLGHIQSNFQIGLEIIPYRSSKDTFEILTILLDAILRSLTDELLIEVGDSRVIEKCVQHVPKKFRNKLFELIDRKDISELELFASLNGLDLTEVLKLVEASFTKRSARQLEDFPLEPNVREEVIEVVELLSSFPNVKVEIDFSLARTVEEYDGLTFTIFDLKEPSLIAAGGRYKVNENLLGVGGTIFLGEKAWSK